ncbi:gliding motility lipoprotein GldH [Echinicola soli]|uniref:Gliding motility lipoprotein GldH n=1 Tax=Echinicola soli TaxID=2591634 RepID=A0A514CCX2_9BACT|nr:gliding motility lipoprotein GldH [Echinicola soli]QDH77663.1 gliding motility lipoprotein GldH [Echinicola soli]
MNNRSMVKKLYGTLLISSLLLSCNNDRVYEEYHGLENLSWPIADTVTFDIETKYDHDDVISTLRVKYNKDYDYYNLYVRYLVRDSLGQIRNNELLNLNLFDPKTGKPLGSGYGNSFTQMDTLPLSKVKDGEKITIQFVQYMRSNDLDGIEAVGIKLKRGVDD